MKRYPGKFEGCADQRLGQALYNATMDGCNEDLGDIEGFGWYGLIKTHTTTYIVSEDGQGFFDYSAYDHETGKAMWDALEAEYETYSQEVEEDVYA